MIPRATPQSQTLIQRQREVRQQIEEGWLSLRNGEGVDGEEFFRSLERREKALPQKREQA
jgi:hypothetical protein